MSEFKTGDKVLVRDEDTEAWVEAVFIQNHETGTISTFTYKFQVEMVNGGTYLYKGSLTSYSKEALLNWTQCKPYKTIKEQFEELVL